MIRFAPRQWPLLWGGSALSSMASSVPIRVAGQEDFMRSIDLICLMIIQRPTNRVRFTYWSTGSLSCHVARESYMLPWSHVASFNWHRRGHNESWVLSSGRFIWKHGENRNGSIDDWHSKLWYYNSVFMCVELHKVFTCSCARSILDKICFLKLGRCRCRILNKMFIAWYVILLCNYM